MGRCSPQPCTNYPLRSGNRVPLHPVANGCRKTRGEGIWIHWIKRCKRVSHQLRCSEPGGSDKVHLHYMCGLPARSVQTAGIWKLCWLLAAADRESPVPSKFHKARRQRMCLVPSCLPSREAVCSIRRLSSRRPWPPFVGNPICYPLVPLGKWAGRIRAGRADQMALVQGKRLALTKFFSTQFGKLNALGLLRRDRRGVDIAVDASEELVRIVGRTNLWASSE